MKFIQKHPLPGQGGCSSLNLQPGSKIVHIGLAGYPGQVLTVISKTLILGEVEAFINLCN